MLYVLRLNQMFFEFRSSSFAYWQLRSLFSYFVIISVLLYQQESIDEILQTVNQDDSVFTERHWEETSESEGCGQ